ncbi:MAG TPA: undecaprenyldiphospho-muramoylpentapeptide beta-N-acetylglucosaminyltransferase, partial [Polyangia bacterium]|nr:undecaprenyldiphospho-muramoylpentapeptide beta-N-acetylglucosaminyltransferase [Polyangia bacterium]
SGLKGTGAAGLVRGLWRLPRAIAQSRRILKRYRPDLVVGVGGYSSGPMVLAAALRRLPTAILEQNSIPGLTNRILGRLARRAFVAFEVSRKYFPKRKTALAGNPIRSQLRTLPKADPTQPTVLVVGGSQGAHALNELVADALAALPAPRPRVVHQTGEADCAAIAARYRELGVAADVRAFIDDMAAAYAAADLVVCRAGATTIAELTAVGRPAIFIPFPFAADDHQFWNAHALADAGAALVHRQSEITPSALAAELAALLADPARRAAMSARMRALGKPDAARDIVDALEQMVKGDVPRA